MTRNAAALAVLTVALSCSAHAATVADLFGETTATNYKCYTRNYNADHMRNYPRQKVTEIKAKLYRDADSQMNTLHIQVRFKRKTGTYSNVFYCSDRNGKIDCGIDCDGGQVELTRLEGDKLTITNTRGFVVLGDCGDPDAREIVSVDNRRGGDDVFWLWRRLPSQCREVNFR
ncbi:MAG: hypothetical protein HY059_13775 [Proteobacteria bacterium]|nr:hypothetical protein [Pseudomonadota bacterium]